MKPQFLKVPLKQELSFSIRRDVVPFFYNQLHYHPEIELLHIEKGSGTQFIGECIRNFTDDHMVIVGSNLPHMWRCDEKYHKGQEGLFAQSTAIHFRPDLWGEYFSNLPEFKAINDFLEYTESGLQIKGETKKRIGVLMREMIEMDGLDRMIHLLKILRILAFSNDITPITSTNFDFSLDDQDNQRLNQIYSYTRNNFERKISLEEVSEVANMSPTSFCRYFKSRMNKTYSQLLLELRVGQACKLLIDGNLSVSQVCFESGFNNISHFNRHFKLITQKTPLQYQHEYRNKWRKRFDSDKACSKNL